MRVRNATCPLRCDSRKPREPRYSVHRLCFAHAVPMRGGTGWDVRVAEVGGEAQCSRLGSRRAARTNHDLPCHRCEMPEIILCEAIAACRAASIARATRVCVARRCLGRVQSQQLADKARLPLALRHFELARADLHSHSDSHSPKAHPHLGRSVCLSAPQWEASPRPPSATMSVPSSAAAWFPVCPPISRSGRCRRRTDSEGYKQPTNRAPMRVRTRDGCGLSLPTH